MQFRTDWLLYEGRHALRGSALIWLPYEGSCRRTCFLSGD